MLSLCLSVLYQPAARESRCEGSPTTQTERDISTISLDDDVSAASEYQVIDEVTNPLLVLLVIHSLTNPFFFS